MKTELAICLVVAAGLHAGLALVGPSMPSASLASTAIEVGLEDGVTDANATGTETIPSPPETPALAEAAPSPPETPIPSHKPEPDLEKHEEADKPVVASSPATTFRSAIPGSAPKAVPHPSATSGISALQSSPARAQSGGGGYSGTISTVRYRQHAALSYPMSALRDRAEGTVILIVGIDESGRAANVTIRQSSGRSDLDAAAIACARQSTYEPYRENGIAQPCRVEAPFRFVPR